jgi:hypothetical protein
LFTQLTFPQTDKNQYFKKRSGLFSHRGPKPLDGIFFRGNQQCGGMGHIPLFGQLMVQIMLSQRNLGAEFAKSANHLPVGMRKNIFVPFGGKQIKRNFIG